MNERIKELKDKIWAEKYWTNPNTDKLLPAQLNRFAELIVQECADIAKHHVMNISTYSDAEFVEKQIREHFGVEL